MFLHIFCPKSCSMISTVGIMSGARVRGAQEASLLAGEGRAQRPGPPWELAPWTGVGRRDKSGPETVCEITRRGWGRRL